MKKILKDWFTGVDGESYDLGRALWALTLAILLGPGVLQNIVLTMCVLSIPPEKGFLLWGATEWAVWASACVAVLPAGAAALMIKRRTEPGSGPGQGN